MVTMQGNRMPGKAGSVNNASRRKRTPIDAALILKFKVRVGDIDLQEK